MRLPWFFGSRPRGRRRAGASPHGGRRQSTAVLRVRQLERRRVLDGAAASLVLGPTIEVGQQSTVTSSVTADEPLVFDWTTSDSGSADTQQTAAPYSAAAAEVGAFMASAENGDRSNGQQPLGLVNNHVPGVTAANSQTLVEDTTLDLSSGPGLDALALVADLDLEDDYVVVVDWGDGSGFQSANPVFSTTEGGIRLVTFGGTHLYANAGTFTVKVRAADNHMEAFTHPSKFNVNPDGTDIGTEGVDFVQDQFQVTVLSADNNIPVITAAADKAVPEGALLDLSGDPGKDALAFVGDEDIEDYHVTVVNWGDGSGFESALIVDSFVVDGVLYLTLGGTHAYASAGSYTVKVRAADNHMGAYAAPSKFGINPDGTDVGTEGVDFVEDEFQVTVLSPKNNVPVVTAAADKEVPEGTLLDLSSDPGKDALAFVGDEDLEDDHVAVVNWGDGTGFESANIVDSFVVEGIRYLTLGGTHVYADGDTTYTVRVRVADSNMAAYYDPSKFGINPDGTNVGTEGVDFVEDTFLVVVSNVVPTLDVTPLSMTLDEGQALGIRALFSDPGFDNPLNTNPTVGPAIGDPLAESFRYYIDWGDGHSLPVTSLPGVDSPSGSSGQFGHSHTYADDGLYTVKVRLADDNMTGDFTTGIEDVDFVEYSFEVTVNNVVPSLSGAADLAVNEGQAFTLDALGVGLQDPGFDNPDNPTTPAIGDRFRETFTSYKIFWGDGVGQTDVAIINRASGAEGIKTTADFSHLAYTYADDGVYTVTVRVADDNMTGDFVNGAAPHAFVDLTFQIEVKNVNPLLAIDETSAVTINESGDVSFKASFTDPGFDNSQNPNDPVDPLILDPLNEKFRYFIDWGDGRDQVGTATVDDTFDNALKLSVGSFGGIHNYADDGEYWITVRIADDNMLAFVDASKFGFNPDGSNQGVKDVDFVEQRFKIIVNNTSPRFIPNADGESFEGDDISSEGLTTIRVSYDDIGYDNPNNRNAPVLPNISNPKYEIFTHLLDWGDGSVDAIHTYAVPGNYTVSVTVAGADLNGAYSFNDFPGSTSSVLTLVSGQTLNVGGESTYTYVINWGDSTIQTVTLDLYLPLAPLASNGRTAVMTALRANGDADSNTSGSFEVQHRYLGPPDPLHPTAPIGITVTVVDDNNATVSDIIFVPNPGINVVNQRIDTTPRIPRLDFPTQPAIQALLPQTTGTIQSLQSSDVGAASGETASTSKRYLELVAYAPDGTVIDRYELPEEELADLRGLFAKLPDGRYQIFLVRTDTNTRRLVMDVYVRRGRLIDRQDDTEGTRDRPPTSESEDNAAALNAEGPALQPAANDAGDDTAAPPPHVQLEEILTTDLPRKVADGDPQTPTANYSSLRWGSSLTGLAIVTGGSNWSRKVDAALARADRRAWQRLRRAGRLGHSQLDTEQPADRHHRELSTINVIDRV